jgi:hypothetical protein
LTFSFLDWSEASGLCGAFTYTVTLSGGAALPSCITYSFMSFTVSTSSTSAAGDYTIKIAGSIYGGT